MAFRKDFLWGVGTSAYQIEGAAAEDGRGPSVWDQYCHEEGGHIACGHTGDVACDHYHRYKEDVQLMRELGIRAYRFSLSWSRILPDGIGAVNQKGIDFYNNLIDELLENGITPCITLFHWDYPYELQKKGAWLNPESSDWFAYYTEVVAKAFGDRVKWFITFNEPQCFLGMGYFDGCNAPGKRHGLEDMAQMLHNMFLAHGKSVLAIRKYVQDAKVGYAPTCGVNMPLTGSVEDIAAARKKYLSIDPAAWIWNVVLWSDPVVLGRYPEDDPFFAEQFRRYLPESYQEDMKIICQPLDFYGQNIYNGSLWKADEKGEPMWVANPVGSPRTANGWPVTPDALYWGPKFLYERYKLPIMITENGLSCHDAVSLDGKVHDPNRIDFTHRYLRSLKRITDEGVDIIGYFHWSLLDNFEWGAGYTERFGLVYVDYTTQERIKKDSFDWYRSVIADNGESL